MLNVVSDSSTFDVTRVISEITSVDCASANLIGQNVIVDMIFRVSDGQLSH